MIEVEHTFSMLYSANYQSYKLATEVIRS